MRSAVRRRAECADGGGRRLATAERTRHPLHDGARHASVARDREKALGEILRDLGVKI